MLPHNPSKNVAELHALATSVAGRKSSATESNLVRIVPSTVTVSLIIRALSIHFRSLKPVIIYQLLLPLPATASSGRVSRIQINVC